jgi:hypothetical protein
VGRVGLVMVKTCWVRNAKGERSSSAKYLNAEFH